MASKLRLILALTFLSAISVFILWLPFFLRLKSVWGIPLPNEGMATIVANYDGPLYIVVAKTLYNPRLVSNFSFGLPNEYYAAHFPLYPILIKLSATFFGFPYAMLFVTAISSILAAYFFYIFIQDFVDKKNALWMTAVFLVFPARWLIVRSVGSPEPLFIASVIATLYYFRKQKYLAAGFWGSMAQLTKSPGILLFVALFLAQVFPILRKAATTTITRLIPSINLKSYLSIFLIPLALISVFVLYKIQLNDFLAYFHSGDNLHLFFPPFQIFNYSQPWVGTFWLEEVIFVYLFGLLGLIKLIKMKENQLAWFVGVFFVSILFVSHRDIIRYSLPIVPFLLAAFSDTIVTKEFKLAMIVLIIPVYLFSLSYISQNVMPVSDWAPLL